jgi:hypothetical protein
MEKSNAPKLLPGAERHLFLPACGCAGAATRADPDVGRVDLAVSINMVARGVRRHRCSIIFAIFHRDHAAEGPRAGIVPNSRNADR